MSQRADSEAGVTGGTRAGDPGPQAPALPAPAALTAQQGAGHIRLSRLPLPGGARVAVGFSAWDQARRPAPPAAKYEYTIRLPEAVPNPYARPGTTSPFRRTP